MIETTLDRTMADVVATKVKHFLLFVGKCGPCKYNNWSSGRDEHFVRVK